MKKIIPLLLLSICYSLSSTNILAQGELIDAQILKSSTKPANPAVFNLAIAGPTLIKIYKIDTTGLSASTIQARINAKLANNPYLKDFTTTGQVRSHHGGIGLMSGVLSSVGGMDVTTIADALSRFMVKRAKQELSISFFTKFKKDLEDTAYSELRILFPVTYKTLKTIDTEIYQYAAYINTLRESFNKDLVLLPKNIHAVLLQEKYKPYFKKHEEIKFIIDNAFIIAEGLQNNLHPGDIVKNISKQNYNNNNDTLQNFISSIKLINLFSQSLRDTSKSRYWVESSAVGQLIGDDIMLQIYLGLLSETLSSQDFFFKSGSAQIYFNKDILAPAANSIDSAKKFIAFTDKLINNLQTIDSKIRSIKTKQKANEKVDYEDYYSVVDNTLNLFEVTTKVDELPYLNRKLANNKIFYYGKSFVYMGKLVNETAFDVHLKNYNSAIINTGMLIDTVFSLMQNKNKGLTISHKITRYGTFIVSLTTAENAEKAEQIIENMALPAGSARIKKHMAFSISLNSYLGGFYGTNDGFKSKDGLSYGVTGLVGVGLNWGIGRKHPMSISAFGNIIDIGALAAFRLNDNAEDYKFKIKLGQILSPGGFVVVGLPNMPISVLAGYQYAPLIRTIQNNSTMLLYDPNYNRGRFTVGVVVDIPLMHFYNKTKKYK